MKVVLIDPEIESVGHDLGPGFREDNEQVGLGYVAAAIAEAGHDVNVITQKDQTPQEVVQKLGSPDIVGFSVFTGALGNAKRIASLINGIPKVAGGVHISTDYMNLDPCFDFGIVGEGERTIIDILDGNFSAPGIAYHAVDGVRFTGPRERIDDLDSLPIPIRSHEQKYGQTPRPSFATGYATLIGSRGCYGNCSFCVNEAMWGCSCTSRSVDNIIDELKDLQDTNYVWFGDENFTQNRERVMEFCSKVSELDIYWGVMGRVNDVDESMLAAMARSGCVQIGYGIESGDDSVLQTYRKGISLSKAKQVVQQTNEAGIMSAAYFVFGEETYHSLESTRKYIEGLEAVRLRLAFVYPFPGTALRERVDAQDLWISDLHKEPQYASTEVPVLKSEVGEAALMEYQREITDAYYKSPRYTRVLETVSSANPLLIKTLDQWRRVTL